jgi:hypothetical protein
MATWGKIRTGVQALNRGKVSRALACTFLLALPLAAAGWGLKNVLREVRRGGVNVGRVFEKAVRDTGKTAGVAIHDIGKATGKAAEDARRNIEIGMQNASRATGKGITDLGAETKRVGKNAGDVGKALGHYLANNVTGTIGTVQDAERRLRQGKILDALAHAALDPWTKQEEAAFKATQESGWLNTAGATAAAAYGGPGGSAAYASWQTYRASGGNAEMALRAGFIAGLAGTAMKGVSSVGGATVPDVAKRAALAGAVGGIAIAASGGGADDIRDGFILGGGMMLVQEGYKSYVEQPLDTDSLKGATGEPYCVSPSDPSCDTLRKAYYHDKDGRLQLDTSKIDRRASLVGVGADPWSPQDFKGAPPLSSDQSTFMRTVARVPGMNAMALFHDKWVVSWSMGTAATQSTIFPAIVLTYYGGGAGLTNAIAEQTAHDVPAAHPKPATQPSLDGVMFNFSNTPEVAGKQDDAGPSGIEGTAPAQLPAVEFADAATGIPPKVYTVEHATAPYRSMLYVRNVANGRIVRAMVSGFISEEDKRRGITMRVSPQALADLAPLRQPFWVEAEFEDVTLDVGVLTPNGDGRDDKLVFNNLGDGAWELWVYDPAGDRIYANKAYKNDWSPPPRPGVYHFELNNISPGQMYRPYNGTFEVR